MKTITIEMKFEDEDFLPIIRAEKEDDKLNEARKLVGPKMQELTEGLIKHISTATQGVVEE
jgi:hypothetical protein